MMFFIIFPDNCRIEHCWIASVLLGEFLGLAFEVRFDCGDKVRIGAAGKMLELSETFFSVAKDKWLSDESLPQEPLQRWAVADSGLNPDLAEVSIPVLYGSAGFEIRDERYAALNLDVFGSAFFMLSRYEEAVSDRRDAHGRFPAGASLAYRENFLERPVVDEYVEILWAAMTRLWPDLKRKPRHFKTLVTCDVDHPYHPSAASFMRLMKRTAGEMIRKRTFTQAITPVRNYLASRTGYWQNDPYYYMVDWMMDVNEKVGNKVAFYFIPEITDAVMDDTCAITDSAVKTMMKRIANRGHEIGIHPGYNTYQSPRNIISGVNRLQCVLDQQRIQQRVCGGRQHYLRWSTRTPAIWNAAGLDYDSTLSYADHAGFRCGTCHEYPMFDLHQRAALKLRQRPLICMESTVTDGLGYTDSALDKMKKLKRDAQRFNGNFTLLWHNSCFETESAREMYCEIIT